MATNNETEFSRKLKRICTNRAVIVTAVTLLVAAGIIVAATVSANRAKRPVNPVDTSGSAVSDTSADPTLRGEDTLPTYNNPETLPTGGEADGKSAFEVPVSGKLYKGHDATIQVYSNTMGDYRVHLGVDIATAAEAPVYAAADGKVEKIWEDAMMGWCVAVTHENDAVTIYKNLAETMAGGIAVGATVKQGQQLGTVGDTAVVEMADEPHLHFEMTVAGLSVDPLDYFSEEAVAALSEDTAYEDGTTEKDSGNTETRPNAK